MMDHSRTMTLDEAITAFDKIAKQWTDVEESFEVNYDQLDHLEKEIEIVEKTVIGENLFSENEEYEEVDEEYAK
jgi:hypothetical protein